METTAPRGPTLTINSAAFLFQRGGLCASAELAVELAWEKGPVCGHPQFGACGGERGVLFGGAAPFTVQRAARQRLKRRTERRIADPVVCPGQ